MKRRMVRDFPVKVGLFVAVFAGVLAAVGRADERPVCRIAAIATPNIHALTKEQLEQRGSRTYFADTVPKGMERAIEAVNRIKPDIFVILGPLTLTGSDADFEKAKAYLAKIEVPVYLLPARNDLKPTAEGKLDGPARFKKHFSKFNVILRPSSLNLKGVHLQFPWNMVRKTKYPDPKVILDWMEKDFAGADGARGVLVFGGPGHNRNDPPLKKQDSRYWELIEKHKVAARLGSSAWGHTVSYKNSLPDWKVFATCRLTKTWRIALVTVYPKRVDLSLVKDEGQPMQTLAVPNPVAAARMRTVQEDKRGFPTYSEDLARKPQLTVVHLSDTQIDDRTVADHGKGFYYAMETSPAVAREVNLLKSDMVFITGDLTNKNTPMEWELFKKAFTQVSAPLYALPGNHDAVFTFEGFIDGYDYYRTKPSLQKTKALVFEATKKYNAEGLTGPLAQFKKHTGCDKNYTVERNGSVFICLSILTQAIDDDTLKFLERELERTKDAKHVFVLGHYPVLPDVSGFRKFVRKDKGGAKVLALLKKYKVAAYLCGHRHFYAYHKHDETMHIVADDLCSRSSWLSYQIYHVFPDRIVSCWRPYSRKGKRGLPLYERVEFPEPRADR